MGSAFGAGAGADALASILKEKFEQSMKMRDFKLREQQQREQSAYQQEALQSLKDQRVASAQLQAQQGARQLAGTMAPGAELDSGAVQALQGGNLGSLIKHKDATLGSTNYSGAVDTSGPASRIVGLAKTSNPGQGPKDIYQGTGEQQQGARQRELLERFSNDPSLTPEARMAIQYEMSTGKNAPAQLLKPSASETQPVWSVDPRKGNVHQIGEVPKGSHFVNEPAPQQTPTVVIQTVDDNGNKVSRIVDKKAGAEFAAAPTTDERNRTASKGRAAPVIKAMADLSEKINTGQGAMAKVQGTIARAQAQANLNDDVSEYEAVVSGFTPLLARAMGHTGVLTEQDVQSVRKMLPDPTDSKNVRDRKIARIQMLLGDSGTDGGAAASASASKAAELIKKYGGG